MAGVLSFANGQKTATSLVFSNLQEGVGVESDVPDTSCTCKLAGIACEMKNYKRLGKVTV